MTGLNHLGNLRPSIFSSEIAMDKQNLFTMKQPELGRKILELRKAKGLTQEELVERCNINVRTIQRIEAGEVIPRTYTIRTILDALGYDLSQLKFESEDIIEVREIADLLRFAFYAGVLYLMLSIVESIVDTALIFSGDDWISGNYYTLLKGAVMITFSIFYFGFYKLATVVANPLLQGATILMLVGITMSTVGDLYGFWIDNELLAGIQVAKAIMFGGLYTVFGAGLLKYRAKFGNIVMIAAVIGIFTGVALLTVILAVPALISLTLFEILLLVILFQVMEKGSQA